MRLLISTLILIACSDDSRETNDAIADTTISEISETRIDDTTLDTTLIDIEDETIEVDAGCTTPPIARCRDGALDLTTDAVTLDPATLDDGSTASCGGTLTFTVEDASLTCDDLGDHAVTLEVHEGENVATCSATITIRDASPPTIECRTGVIDLGIIDAPVDIPITDLYLSTSDNCSTSLTFFAPSITYYCDGLGATNAEANFDGTDDAGNRSNFCHNAGIFMRCPLEGDIVDVWVNDTGSVTRRADATVAITQLQSTGYLTPNAVAFDADGYYQVVPPGVPYQPALLTVQPVGGVLEGFVRTSGPHLDRRRVMLGRPDGTLTYSGTQVQASITGMVPVADAALAIVSLGSGTNVFQYGGGTESATVPFDVTGQPRIDGARGDVAWLVQHVLVAGQPEGAIVMALTRAAQLPSDFAFPGSSGSVAVSADLSVPAVDGTAVFDIDVAAFDALVPREAIGSSLRATHSVVLTDEPIAAGASPELVIVSLDSSITRFTSAVPYKDPYPATLPRRTTMTFTYRWLVDGQWLVGDVSARAIDDAVLVPDVVPPTAVTLTSAEVTWTGTAPLFDVTLYRLDPELTPMGVFETTLKRFVPPAGLLTTGRYVARVTARSATGRASALSPMLVVP